MINVIDILNNELEKLFWKRLNVVLNALGYVIVEKDITKFGDIILKIRNGYEEFIEIEIAINEW